MVESAEISPFYKFEYIIELNFVLNTQIVIKYSEEIILQMDFLDNLLDQYGQPPILSNSLFEIDELSWEYYLKAKFRKDSFINFDLILTESGTLIEIDRTIETLGFDLKKIETFKILIEEYIKIIFTCTIMVKYCGHNYTKIYFFNSQGEVVKTVRFISGLFWKFGCTTKTYSPIYEG